MGMIKQAMIAEQVMHCRVCHEAYAVLEFGDTCGTCAQRLYEVCAQWLYEVNDGPA